MLLEQLLDQPHDSPYVLFRRVPYGAENREQLVRDIIALANAELDAPRYIVFGAERQNGASGNPGLNETQLETVKSDNREAAGLIEPELQLSPVYARIEGKFFAAVEIDACENQPYVVKNDMSRRLRRGECWVRTQTNIRPAQRQDLDRMYAKKAAEPEPAVRVGLNADPACEVLELEIPDVSKSPSSQALERLGQAIEAKKAAQQHGRDDTGMARLVHARLYGADVPFVPRGLDTLVEGYNSAEADYRKADHFYFYEQQAIKLNLTVANNTGRPLENAVIELSIPRAEDFDVADEIAVNPDDDTSSLEQELMGYPQVRKTTNAIRVRAPLGELSPGARSPAFECALRLAVGPKMKGRKIAIRYVLAAHGLDEPCRGRLKLKFHR